MKLVENACLSGITKTDFSANLKEFQSGLHHENVDGKHLIFAYYEGITEEDEILLSVFPAGEFTGFVQEKFKKSDYPDELIEELKLRRICLIEDEKIVFMSPNVEYSEMYVKGDFFANPTKEAIIAISRAAARKSYTLISRTFEGQKKVFAIRSAKYLPIDQNVIFDVIAAIEDSCGTYVKWEKSNIYNLYTEVIVSLPEASSKLNSEYSLPATYTPCLMVRTSDTGDSSFAVYEAWKVYKNTYMFGNCIAKRHSGEFDECRFANAVKENIYDKLYLFPEKLAEAALIDVSPFGLSLSKEGAALGNKLNLTNWSKTVKAISKFIGLTKEVGKKTEKEIVESLINNFNPTTFVTLYDVISEFLSLPERLIGIGAAKQRKLQSCVMKSAYYRPSSNEEESVII